jgi:hypothetical protein
VTTEIERLRFQETALTQELCALERDGGDKWKREHFLWSLLDVQDQAARLDRMLDAMSECGFSDRIDAASEGPYLSGDRALAFA